jgi:hypothetical protein
MFDTVTYRSSNEIETVVRKFEKCEYGVTDFDHSKHLAVAGWYLACLGLEEALTRMRSALLRFTRHHHVKGYHETITRFWLLLVQEFLLSQPPRKPFTEQVNELIQCYCDKNILFEYYSRERVMSDQAREQWIEPDLKQLCSLKYPCPS